MTKADKTGAPPPSREMSTQGSGEGGGADLLSGRELREIGEAIRREFSPPETEPGVILMEVDPFHLRAYWHLAEFELERARSDFASAGEAVHLVLRFRETAEPSSPTSFAGAGLLTVFDRELAGPSGHEDIRVPEPGRGYQAELGLIAADGGWMPLARSNAVRMPPAAPSRQAGGSLVDVSRVAPGRVVAHDSMGHGSGSWRGIDLATVAEVGDPSLRGGPPEQLVPEFPAADLCADHPFQPPPGGAASGVVRALEPQVPQGGGERVSIPLWPSCAGPRNHPSSAALCTLVADSAGLTSLSALKARDS